MELGKGRQDLGSAALGFSPGFRAVVLGKSAKSPASGFLLANES